jgi:putative protease
MTTAATSAPSTDLKLPEILAPVGNEEMLRAAMENGADAVYFGLQQFNARLRAANFRTSDLPWIMRRLHERGMRGYVTLNTLIFDGELQELAGTLIACSDAGVDAILVQDLGVAWLANQLVPGLPVHASTQMTVTCAESITGLEALGLQLERIVVARELNRRELAKITAATTHEIEVFVHGAICVAYSGQCLTSEALGGRSANRGECAQACRLPYDLVVDGQPHDVDGLKYLLSPKDLAAWEDIGDLMRIGIASLKIEGRLKSPEYVAATVQSYRAAVAEAAAGHELHMPEPVRRRLEMTFSRGFTGGYLHETNHQAVVEGRFPKKRGLAVGRVIETHKGGVILEATGPVKLGDGLVFDAGRPDGDEEGGRVYEIERSGRRLEAFDPLTDGGPATLLLRFQQGKLRLGRISVGQRVWKTSDPALDGELRATFEGDAIRHRRPIDAWVRGRLGEPLRLTFVDEDGIEATVEDSAPTEAARQHPLAEPVLREQFGRLGGTPFELRHLYSDIEGQLMVPKSRLNELRRRVAELLIEKRQRRGTDRPVRLELLESLLSTNDPSESPPPTCVSRLSALCRSLEQVEAAVAFGGLEYIYTDFEDIRLHREARKLVPAGGPRFAPASLRIVKPGESGFVRKLLEAVPDAILVRNLASRVILQQEAPTLELIGDYPLNVANHLTARLLHADGFRRLVPSYDLNIDQLLQLLSASPPDLFEVTIHQYMPMFHMEHCVFCRFLSTGTDFTNCGRPCESHKVALRDRMGYEHLLKADAGCRNTVFNAVAQSGSAYLTQLLRAGVRRFRVDLLAENAAQTTEVLAGYAPAIRGEVDGSSLWRQLKASSKLGVTKGSLDHE